jgi:hypothetical protein
MKFNSIISAVKHAGKQNEYISLVPLLLFKMVLTNEGINGVSSL